MPETVNQAYIFVPMMVVILLTFLAFIRMGAGRGAAMKAGQDPNYYKAYTGDPEPEATIIAVRHYGNMFEMPTVFYAACLTAFVLSAVSFWTVLFAWGYVAGRLVQSAVHLTYNNPGHRGMAFVLSVLFLLAMWVTLAMAVCAQL
ncbi:MAG: MAPEG family protein [Novosphingobium sp.]|nr:MAPEG family protein [Novosphingobium sp.]